MYKVSVHHCMSLTLTPGGRSWEPLGGSVLNQTHYGVERSSPPGIYMGLVTPILKGREHIKRKDVLIPATTWMNLKNIMLSGRSQTQRDKYRMIPFT